MARLNANNAKGLTLIELLIGLAIVSILITLASPALSNFVAGMRVDSEISSLQRLLLQARNQAITSGQNVTLCPLDSDGDCTSNWEQELTLFTDDDRNRKYEASKNEQIIQRKPAIEALDTLTFGSISSAVTYSPEGRTTNGSFRFCPYEYEKSLSRAITIGMSGRIYQSSDTDGDGVDEDASGNDVSCS